MDKSEKTDKFERTGYHYRYPFSPTLMQKSSFTHYEKGFEHSNPNEWLGPVGLAVDWESEVEWQRLQEGQPPDDNNVFLGRINNFIINRLLLNRPENQQLTDGVDNKPKQRIMQAKEKKKN